MQYWSVLELSLTASTLWKLKLVKCLYLDVKLVDMKIESSLNIPERRNNILYIYLFHAVTTLQLKEELTDGEDYNFLQGASDQESNGSANFYIKQEPWVAQKLRVGGEDFYTGLICSQFSCTAGLFYWDILLNIENFSSRFFRWVGKLF